ncbi:MAG: hypothetical protein AB1633_01175 [Elusimicrobiota bacterium]
MEKVEQNSTVEVTPIEKILLDSKVEKYKIVSVATRWIEEISKKEEYKYLTFNQLLEVALKDIITGKVSIEEIQKLPPLEFKKPKEQTTPVTTKKVSREIKDETKTKKK